MAGGTWSSSNTAIATAATLSSTTGGVYGVSAGTVTITYTVSSGGCTRISLYTVTVNPLPVFTVNPAVVFCQTATMTIVIGAGTGATYTWAGPPTLSATTGTTVSVSGLTTPGLYIYTVTCTDANGCHSTRLDTVIVMDCNCNQLGGSAITALRGTVAGPVTLTGSYYVYGNVTFTGSVLLQNAVMLIAPNLKMDVTNTSDLEIDHSHLFSCQMWRGITLLSNTTTQSAKCYVHNNSLIEDAAVAIYVPDGVAPLSGRLLVVDGCTFNRDSVGVAIYRYPSASSSAPSIPSPYPFMLRAGVYTSRDLGIFSGYPMAWPFVSGTSTALQTQWTPTTAYTSPFNVDNPNGAGSGMPYRAIRCKNNKPAHIGIDLREVGQYAFTAPTTGVRNAIFNQILIGDSTYHIVNASVINLFDTLHYGIRAEFSSLECYANMFVHMYPERPPVAPALATTDGAGISATAIRPLLTGPHAYCQLKMGGFYANPYDGATDNVFYDCHNGVYSYDMYYIKAEQAHMYSHHNMSGLPATFGGVYGFNIASTLYKHLAIKYNELNNIYRTGIFIKTTPGSPGAGRVYASGNIINSNIGGTGGTVSSASPRYVENAIVLSNTLGGITTGLPTYENVQADSNGINYVYNGITVSGYNKQKATSDTNTIFLAQNLGAIAQQFGIQHTSCANNAIRRNIITGPGWNFPAISAAVYGTRTTADKAIVGIYGGMNTNALVSCNEVNYTTTGFQFYGNANYTQWYYNVMHRNEYGFVLDGVIGNQVRPGTLPSDNEWVGPLDPITHLFWYDYTTGFGTPNFATFTVNRPVLSLSVLSVRLPFSGTAAYSPWNNYGNPPFPPNVLYGLGSPTGYSGWCINTLTGSYAFPDCIPTNWSLTAAMMPAGHGAALDTIAYYSNVGNARWMAQMGLYKAMVSDTSLADSSAILHQFRDMAATSRYAWVSRIDSALSNEDTTTAAALLAMGIHADTTTAIDTVYGVVMADDTLADTVVMNYYKFYRIYLRYMAGAMGYADSCELTALANLCPKRDGEIVYQARGLYRTVFNDPGDFNDNCMDSAASSPCDTCDWHGRHAQHGGKGALAKATQQRYKLFPNPNEGNFTLQQMLDDDKPVTAEVTDALGRVLYKQVRTFSNNKLRLALDNVPPGLYLLHITDSSGKMFNFKFVIAKQ